MARPKGAKDIAPMIRSGFIMAVKQLENGGKPLSTIIKQQLEEKPLETLKAMSSFVPKESTVNVNNRTVKSVSELTDAELEQLKSLAITLIGGNGDAEAGESSPEPDSVH